MAYSPAAVACRRCLGTRKDGQPCRGWALWNDPRQLCLVHAGRHHTGPLPKTPAPPRRARLIPCMCTAYPHPHRPGSGLCQWPDPPFATSPLVGAGERLPGVLRTDTAAHRRLCAAFGKADVDRQRAEIAGMVRSALGYQPPKVR